MRRIRLNTVDIAYHGPYTRKPVLAEDFSTLIRHNPRQRRVRLNNANQTPKVLH